MKKMQHITTYQLYRSSINNDIKIVSISDLHFSTKVSDCKLQCLYERILKINPKYLFIAGDLIDSSVVEEEEKVRLLHWLERLSRICTICISIGNHEFYKYENYIDESGQKRKTRFYFNNEIFEEISNISNVYVLNNDVYEDDSLYVAGITLPYDYYKKISAHRGENKELLMETLASQRSLLSDLPKNKVKFALIHSPVYLQDEDVKKELLEFDYLIAGHMHNGCVVPGLYEIWRSSRGIISPYKTPLPNNARTNLKTTEDKLIVNGACVTFQKCTGWLQAFNILFPIYMTELVITNDSKYDTSYVYKKSRYHR